MILVVLFALLVRGEFAIDDENPSLEHFCVLDPTTGEPLNCDADAEREWLQSRVKCTGTELGPLGTSCELRNVCYDARHDR